MASSSQASAASRPASSAASRSSGRSAALRRGGRRGPGQLERARPAPLGDLLARADPDARDERLPAGDLAHRRVGGRGAVEVQHAVEDRDARRRPRPRRRRASSQRSAVAVVVERPRGDQRRARGARPARAAAAARPAAGRRRRRREARALRRAERREDRDVRRLAGVPAHDVAPVGGPELPRELELDESEERGQSPWRRHGAGRGLDVERVLRRRRRRPSGSGSCPGGP